MASIDWASVVKALEGKDLYKPIPVYDFPNYPKVEYPNINPYTGSST